MLLILSGEGPSDIGRCSQPVGVCRDQDFTAGPMTILVDQIVSARMGYSILRDTPDRAIFLSKAALAAQIETMKGNKRGVALTGKKAGQETGYHMKYAWAFGKMAAGIEVAEDDRGVAVFFRDSDGTNANPGGNWDEKWSSIERGFQRAEYPRGVPMLPKPTSEAWLLCAAKTPPYENCEMLEDLPGNVVSDNHPKQKLEEAFGTRMSASNLSDWLSDCPLDLERASAMPSFRKFRERLNAVLGQIAGAQE